MVDLEFLNERDFNYIASILDLNYCYLLTYLDISTGEVNSINLEYNDEILINKLLSINVKEVVVTNDFKVEIINKLVNNYNINVSISNEYLDDEYTGVYADVTNESIIMGIKHILYYLHVKQLKDLSHLSKVNILKSNDYLEMDIHTIRNLELVETLRLKERKYSLIWLLDKTKTAPGARLLKSWLLNPLIDASEIEKRYDYIDNLNTHFLEREQLRNSLYNVYDLERLCGKIICGNLNARDVLQIKTSLKEIPIIDSLAKSLGFNFKINNHEKLYNLLDKAIYEEPPISIKEGFLIKEGYNSELDELKSIRSGGKDFISKIENELKESTGIQNLKVGYNKVFGYYIEVSKGSINKIDASLKWERRQTLTNAERYITPELKEKEALVLNAEEKIIDLEYNLFVEIRNILKENVSLIQETANSLSIIDVLTSLSIVSEEYHLVRPKLNNNHNLRIINGSHPVVECVSNNQYIKNDIIMDSSTSTLLITGPNMSGKSTYMRQLAITIILAQMGSFVPASEAQLPIFDKIFTRIGASDDLVSGESTFMVEMLEAKHAITNATENSLILFDELGRGTATYDGMSLARAILEYVNDYIKCKTLFSTHYHELTELANTYSSIKNVHVDVIEEDGNITFLHKIKDGAADKSYGIHVASLAGMPEELLNRATEILKYYESNKDKKQEHYEQMAFNLEEKNKPDELREHIKEIDPLQMTPLDAINELFKIKEIMKKV
jgi:DNA mismatch repair protein MutS